MAASAESREYQTTTSLSPQSDETRVLWHNTIMTSTATRRPALDGLRGLAALVVVISHCLVVAPVFAGTLRFIPPPAGSWEWFLTYTPLHVFWAGEEAVFIFFVLSGLVLTLPAAGGHQINLRSYYVKRLIRLYLPVLAASILAVIAIYAIPRRPHNGSSWWLLSHDTSVNLQEFLTTIFVLQGGTGLLGVLWSLKWEVIFSLSLPIFFFLFLRRNRWLALQVPILLALIIAGQRTEHNTLIYLPIFAFGVLMANDLKRLEWLGSKFDNLVWVIKAGLVAVFVGLLTARWWLPFVPGVPTSHKADAAELQMTLVGACFIVWLFLSTTWGRNVGTHPVLRQLGKRSFSLYLVHEPVVVSVAYYFHGVVNELIVLLIAVPISIILAEFFGKFVEEPSRKLAEAAGRRMNTARVPLLNQQLGKVR